MPEVLLDKGRGQMNRKELGLVLVLAVIAGLIGGELSRLFFQRESFVEAQEFRLVDKEGKACARLVLFEEKFPGLFFYDQTGKPRALLSLSENWGPELILKGDMNMIRLGISGGNPLLLLCDQSNLTHANISLSKNQARLSLGVETISPNIELAVGEEGNAHISLHERGRCERIRLGSEDGSLGLYLSGQEPHVCLCDQHNTPRASLCLLKNGRPNLRCFVTKNDFIDWP